MQRKPWAVALGGAAALVPAAVVVGHRAARPGGLVVLAAPYRHLALSGWAALALLAGAAALGVRGRRARPTALFAVGLLAVGWLVVGQFAGPLTADGEHVASRDAPGRTDRRLVVTSPPGALDPQWIVFVEQGDWPMVRRWPVASFDGDDDTWGFADARWDGPDRIRLTPRGHPVQEVAVGASGRPEREVRFG
ncbi:hypothetical protein [Streptomyces sp. NPDC093225]|uniref:hypothetical protein n=1 Tax=Streptomyces sp. NPDC093225 TaxID=3366034 RepID=UPI00380AB55B